MAKTAQIRLQSMQQNKNSISIPRIAQTIKKHYFVSIKIINRADTEVSHTLLPQRGKFSTLSCTLCSVHTVDKTDSKVPAGCRLEALLSPDGTMAPTNETIYSHMHT